MVVPRAPIRSAASWASCSVRPGRTQFPRVRLRQRIQSRGYQGPLPQRGDLPWAIPSALVTIPACIYLLQPTPTSDHGHGDEHGEHGAEKHEAGEESDTSAEDREPGDIVPDLRKNKSGEEADNDDEQAEDQGDEKSSEQSEESAGEAGDQQETPDTSEDEGSQNVADESDSGKDVEDVQSKGSHYGIRQGVAGGDNIGTDESYATQDKPATAKTPGGGSTMSGKQEGLSNTDTKHSTDVVSNPEKSKKGEGTPETAKSKGTVDPGRPQA